MWIGRYSPTLVQQNPAQHERRWDLYRAVLQRMIIIMGVLAQVLYSNFFVREVGDLVIREAFGGHYGLGAP